MVRTLQSCKTKKGICHNVINPLFDNALYEDILLDSPSNYNGISGVTTMVHTVVIDFAIDDRACSTVDRTHK